MWLFMETTKSQYRNKNTITAKVVRVRGGVGADEELSEN